MTKRGEYSEYDWNSTTAPESTGYIASAVLKISRQFKPGSRILDVGCGNGSITGLLHKAGHNVIGIDLSAAGIALARKAFPDCRFEVVGWDETTLKTLGEPPLDIIVSTEVIEHLYAPRAFFKTSFSSLRPGGILICSTPYHGYLKNLALSVFNKWDSHIDPLWDCGHIKFWSRRTLTRALEEAGFTELKFFGVGRMPWLWKSMVMVGTKPS